MTEEDYVKHLARVTESVTVKYGGSFVIRGRKAWVYWSTKQGTIVSTVWLGRLDENERLRPTATIVTGPPIVGDFEQVVALMEDYRQAVAVLQRIVTRLSEDAVEWIEDIEEEDIITEDEEEDE